MTTTMDGDYRGTDPAESAGNLCERDVSSAGSDQSIPKPAYEEARFNREQVLTGVGLSAGIAIGRPCFYRTPDVGTGAESQSTPDQAARVRRALLEIYRFYSDLARQADRQLNKSAGDIFRAQSMLASDESLIATLERRLAASYACAEAVVTETLESYASEMLSAQSDYIRERASDITELEHFMLMCLGDSNGYVSSRDSLGCRDGDCHSGQAHILVATHFMPGAALTASRFTKGFVVETGGPSSHAAILARMVGLPAVRCEAGLTASLPEDSHMLVDGDSGRVYINPSAATLAAYRQRLQLQQPRSGSGHSQVVMPPVKGFRILADLDRIDDMPQVMAAQAEGIGLYRSESEVLCRQRLLSEDEQCERYTQLLDAVTGPVCVRLLDLGADKSADWLGLSAEDNPALGCRGARLLLERPELLQSQARALGRASRQGRIHVLYPMVHSVKQYRALRELFDAAISDLADTDLVHGVMFEVPSACLEARELFEYADFGRIGTNDLAQYLFASDRMNGSLEPGELFDRPALWHVIDNVVCAADRAGKPVSMCGELVTHHQYIARMLAAGICEISTHPRYIAGLRQAASRLLDTPENYCCSASGQYSFLTV